jgi:hypothetical protein
MSVSFQNLNKIPKMWFPRFQYGFSLSRETNGQKVDATKRTHKCDVDETSAPFWLLKLRNKWYIYSMNVRRLYKNYEVLYGGCLSCF